MAKFNKKRLKKILKRTGWSILILIGLINVFILLTGRFYLYKAIANTVLVGRLGPSIDEYGIFYNRTIEAGEPQHWKTHPDYSSNQLRKKDIERLEEISTVSYLIIKKDSLFFEKYWEDFNKSSITNSFSVAKSVVSILIGIAIDEGHIQSLDQKVIEFLPDYDKGGKDGLTLRHLLTMSSGLDWSESGGNPLSHNAEAYYGWDLKGLMDELEVETEPGKTFNYMSGNTQILAFVLEKATGKSLSEYASEKIWKPLGAESDALWNLDDKDGHEKAFCCIYATSRDFARIGQLFLNDGIWNGERVISKQYIDESVRPADIQNQDGSNNTKYGLSWWLTEFEGKKVYYARGILGQYIICLPWKDMVVVRTGYQRGDKLPSDHPEDIYWYIEAALAMVS